MKKLLQPGTIHALVKHPEKLDLNQLLQATHQVFIMQTTIGVISFVKTACSHSISLDNIANVVIPVIGFFSTTDDDPENFRRIRWCAIYWIIGLVAGLIRAIWSMELQGLLVCLLKTAIFAVQWMALARLWRGLQDKQLIDGMQVQFYLNIAIKNKTECIKSTVQQKHRHLGKLLGKIADKIVTEDKFTAKLGGKLEIMIPKKMSEQGITAKATKQFHKGNLIVLLIEVVHVDARALITQKNADEKVHSILDFLLTVLGLIPDRFRIELEHIALTKMASGLMAKLPNQMANQMKEMGGLEVEVEARSKEEEAQFLFAALHEMEPTGEQDKHED